MFDDEDLSVLSSRGSDLTVLGIPATVVVAAVIEDSDRFLVTRRLPGAHLAGMWEFPGGKIDTNEIDEQALRRELLEELGVDADVGERVHQARHAYPDRTIELHFYSCTLRDAPRPALGQEMRWVPRAELRSLGFPPADSELITILTSSGHR